MNTINILGTEYQVLFQTEKQNPKLKDNNGLCEIFDQKIILDISQKNDPDVFDNVEAFYNKVLRHELFHAILAEAGLWDYCHDETLVDALAMLYPKIKAIMDKANVFDFIKE